MNENNVKIKLNSKVGAMTFAVFMVAYIVTSLFGQWMFSAILGTENIAYRLICSCFSPICIFAVFLFYILYGKYDLKTLMSTSNVGGWYLVLAVVLSCGMFLGLGFVNQSVVSLFDLIGIETTTLSIEMNNVWDLVLYSFFIAVLPALLEEVLFRGILLSCFAGMKKHVAVLISALLFSLYHQSFVQLIYQFIYGVALGYLAICAKSILPCIISHFLNNFAVLLLTYLKVNVDLFNLLYIGIGFLLLFIFTILIMITRLKAQNFEGVKGEVKRFFVPFGIIAIITCVAVSIGNLLV